MTAPVPPEPGEEYMHLMMALNDAARNGADYMELTADEARLILRTSIEEGQRWLAAESRLAALSAQVAALTQDKERERARFDYLWTHTTWPERHKWGGDANEAREGVDAARAHGSGEGT